MWGISCAQEIFFLAHCITCICHTLRFLIFVVLNADFPLNYPFSPKIEHNYCFQFLLGITVAPLRKWRWFKCVMGNACKIIGEMQLPGHVSGYLFLVTHVTQCPMLKHMLVQVCLAPVYTVCSKLVLILVIILALYVYTSLCRDQLFQGWLVLSTE